VAGQTPRAIQAFANLTRICEEHLAGKYRIEVIDLLKAPQLAQGDQIVALPTLVRKLPEPVRKIIGDLSNTEKVLVGLDCGRGLTGGVFHAKERGCHGRLGPRGQGSAKAHYLLKLYVAGVTPRSSSAVGRSRTLRNVPQGAVRAGDHRHLPATCTGRGRADYRAPTLIKKLHSRSGD